MALELKVGQVKGVAVIVCRGRIVFGSETTELSRTIRLLLPENPRVVLNLGAVQTIDSGGLGTLLGLVASARRGEGDIKLCSVSAKVREVLQLTKLIEVLAVLPDEATAVAAFPPSRIITNPAAAQPKTPGR